MAAMRQPGAYPTDVSDEEWAFVCPYVCLMREDAPQRVHNLRAVPNALRYLVRAGCPWRLLPNDLPPWQIVHQQATRWLEAGVFEAIVHDLRMILRPIVDRLEQPPRRPGCAHPARQHRERAALGLQRPQKAQGREGALGREHLGPPARRSRLSRQRERTRPKAWASKPSARSCLLW